MVEFYSLDSGVRAQTMYSTDPDGLRDSYLFILVLFASYKYIYTVSSA